MFESRVGRTCLLQVGTFEGLCYTTPFIGALLADSKWGR